VAKAEENLVTQSNAINVWAGQTAVVTSANTSDTTAPDGTSTAEKISETTATSNHRVTSNLYPFVSGLTYTSSIFAKAGTVGVVQIATSTGPFGTNAFANFDLTNGVLGTVGSSATATIASVGNGWYRCSITATCTASDTGSSTVISFANNSTTATRLLSYAGDTASNLYLWGGQLEQRSSVTAYTATTDQPITNYIPVLLTAGNNVPRFEHNPVTGESLGLEIEEQRTNLVLRSEEFNSTPSWGYTNTTVRANQIIAPDGTLTGDEIIEGTGSQIQFASQQSITGVAGTTYTASVYVKRGVGTSRGFRLEIGGGGSGFRANFNPDTGGVNSSSFYGTGTVVASGSVDVGNGWRRYFVTGTAGSDTALQLFFPRFLSTPTGSTIGYTGDGIQSFFFWGAQLEAGAFATSYIPTVASQVTRSADVASMTGTNFSSWYRTDEGTVYSEAISISVGGHNEGLAVIHQDGSNFIGLGRRYAGGNNPNIAAFVYTNGANQAYIGTGTVTSGVSYKASLSYKVNDITLSVNAGTPATDTSAIIPASPSQLMIGRTHFSEVLNGTIKKLAYYPKRLSNAELQGLTA
jgi:hypothetical protein